MTRLLCLFLLLGLVCCQPEPAEVENDVASASRTTPADFVGSDTCRPCHERAWNAWITSQHAQAERPVDLELDAAAFRDRVIEHGDAQESRVRVEGGTPQIVTLSGDGKVRPRDAVRAIGVEPFRQYLVEAEGGRLQAVALAYDPHRDDWFDVFGDENRRPKEWGFWDNRALTWNSMCAECHNTNLEKGYLPYEDRYETTFEELGVGCEACHGPGQAHVDWQRRYADSEEPDPTRADLLLMGRPDRWLDACGRCHSRRGELGTRFTPGELLFESYWPELPGHEGLYYADGQVLGENYEYTSFRLSKMHERGLQCVTCHEPHSGALREEGDQLCLSCHGKGPDADSPFIDAAHSHHVPDTPGSRCVDCHMPETVYMERDPRRDHSFSIPDPWLTKESGVPNACGRCHEAEGVDWAIERVSEWYGDVRERETQKRARRVTRARRGADDSPGELLSWSQSEPSAAWRGVSLKLMAPWAAALPPIQARLVQALQDPDPWVRIEAARALDGIPQESTRPLPRLLDDPVRGVRVAAAWVLRDSVDPSHRAAKELIESLRFGSDQPAGLHRLAGWQFARGDDEAALKSLRRAVRWDPYSPPLHQTLAEMLSVLGRAEQARDALEQACEQNPRAADLRFSLALSRVELGDSKGAEADLERATTIDPSHARAFYNLGLLRAQLGKTDAAIDALSEATRIEPRSSDFWLGLVTVCRDAGRLDQARWSVDEGLRYLPGDPTLRSLKASLK
ncbi:MAG: tetratricopeptide repeat protein [Planctomycetota bacterium]